MNFAQWHAQTLSILDGVEICSARGRLWKLRMKKARAFLKPAVKDKKSAKTVRIVFNV